MSIWIHQYSFLSYLRNGFGRVIVQTAKSLQGLAERFGTGLAGMYFGTI
jgi:hypothetical protein